MKRIYTGSKTGKTYAGVWAFLVASTVVDSDARTSGADLFAAYREWFPGVGEEATRNAFTRNAQEAYRGVDGVRYGPTRFGGTVERGFTGIRLSTPDDNMLGDIPAGRLSVARDMISAAAARHSGDTALVADLDRAAGLLLTFDSAAWSQQALRTILGRHTAAAPELNLLEKVLDV